MMGFRSSANVRGFSFGEVGDGEQETTKWSKHSC